MGAKEIYRKMWQKIELTSPDIDRGVIIAYILAKNNIDLLYQSNSYTEEVIEAPKLKKMTQKELNDLITIPLLEHMLEWDETHHI